MSRCFPYPPHGYTLSKASNEALIESIKLQKKKDKAKSESGRKKEKKRDKKEKKLREEKTKFQSNVYDKDKDGSLSLQERKEEAEQLERSNITEEHELPICSENPSYSSDSSQNSNKKKRHLPPLDNTHVKGNILRIQLPSQKQLKCDTQDEIQLCSSSGRMDSPGNELFGTRTDANKYCSTSTAADWHVQGLPPGQLNETNFRDLPNPCQENINSNVDSKGYKKLSKVVQQYNDLTETWKHPSHSSDEYKTADDQEWLFAGNRQDLPSEKKDKAIDQISCSGSSTLWARAQYLPDADIYILPFTVPF